MLLLKHEDLRVLLMRKLGFLPKTTSNILIREKGLKCEASYNGSIMVKANEPIII